MKRKDVKITITDNREEWRNKYRGYKYFFKEFMYKADHNTRINIYQTPNTEKCSQ